MKKIEEVKKELFATLWELENTTPNPTLKKYLQIKLETLNSILDEEDIQEEYWERIEEALADLEE